jgi:hypothetical protein
MRRREYIEEAVDGDFVRKCDLCHSYDMSLHSYVRGSHRVQVLCLSISTDSRFSQVYKC